MSSKLIYLAGSIAGKTFKEADSWRSLITEYLQDDYPNVTVRNPLRGKEHLPKKFTKFKRKTSY